MAFVLPENVQETSTTTGTGQITLAGAAAGAYEFDSQLANNDTTYYTISDGIDIEVGEGTFTNSAGNKLTRDTILYSTNGGSAVNWGAGTRNVYSGLPGAAVGSLLDPSSGTGILVQTAANTYERQPVTTALDSQLGWIAVTDPAYGADPTGIADSSAEIQDAIDAAELVPGAKVIFPPGQYNLGTTGVTILGDGIVLEGTTPRFVGASAFGVEFLYSGTGDAVTFGSSAKTAHYRNGFNNIQIRATGAATSSASAVGLKLINQHYLNSDESAIKDFGSGIGLLFAPAGVGAFGALCAFKGFIAHACKTGVEAVSPGAPISENVATFYGGTLIGDSSAGSIGLNIGVDNGGFIFYATDFESFEIAVVIYGSSNKFIGTRSEFNTSHVFDIRASGDANQILMHGFIGTPAANLSEMIVDAGTNTIMSNRTAHFNSPRFQGIADKTEVLAVTKADGTTVIFDVSTSGTPSVDIVNATNFSIFSDTFITSVFGVDGTTGQVTAKDIKSAKLLMSEDVRELLHVTEADGTSIFNVSTDISSRVGVGNGAPLSGFSDTYSTEQWQLDSATGELKGKTLTANGTAVALGFSGVSIGGNTATTVGAAGGAAVLPATPLGYINCYIGSTAVKIPYYSN